MYMHSSFSYIARSDHDYRVIYHTPLLYFLSYLSNISRKALLRYQMVSLAVF